MAEPDRVVTVAALDEILRIAATSLAEAGVETPDADAELLLAHVLGVTRGRVRALALIGQRATIEQAAAMRDALGRRMVREPLQHITGTAHFRTLDLAVGPGVFVPRPETEYVAQLAIDAARSVASPEPIVVDLCSGSGAIALSIAVEVPTASVIGVEKSAEAYEWALRNLSATEVTNARLELGDIDDALHELDGRVDVVVSNPPYVPEDAVPRDPEVRLHDPALALYGGADGLDVVRIVSRTARRLLHPGGTLVVEHGDLQGPAVHALLISDGWHAVSTHRDLTLRDRAATCLR